MLHQPPSHILHRRNALNTHPHPQQRHPKTKPYTDTEDNDHDPYANPNLLSHATTQMSSYLSKDVPMNGKLKEEVVKKLGLGSGFASVSYSKQGITTIPTFLTPTTITHLNLEWNLLGSLNGLESLPNLLHVNIRQNLLESLPLDILVSCPKLKELYVGENLISRITVFGRDVMSNSDDTDMAFNELRSSMDNTQPHPLRVLDLGKNRLQTLPTQLFEFIKELRVLDVSKNALQSLPPSLWMVKSLEIVDLEDNFFSDGLEAVLRRGREWELGRDRVVQTVKSVRSFSTGNVINLNPSSTTNPTTQSMQKHFSTSSLPLQPNTPSLGGWMLKKLSSKITPPQKIRSFSATVSSSSPNINKPLPKSPHIDSAINLHKPLSQTASLNCSSSSLTNSEYSTMSDITGLLARPPSKGVPSGFKRRKHVRKNDTDSISEQPPPIPERVSSSEPPPVPAKEITKPNRYWKYIIANGILKDIWELENWSRNRHKPPPTLCTQHAESEDQEEFKSAYSSPPNDSEQDASTSVSLDSTPLSSPSASPIPCIPTNQDFKRQYLILEILSTERTYVTQLESLNEIYIHPLKSQQILSQHQRTTIFGNIENVLRVQQEFLKDLEKECAEIGSYLIQQQQQQHQQKRTPRSRNRSAEQFDINTQGPYACQNIRLGALLRRFLDFWKIYVPYCEHIAAGMEFVQLLETFGSNSASTSGSFSYASLPDFNNSHIDGLQSLKYSQHHNLTRSQFPSITKTTQKRWKQFYKSARKHPRHTQIDLQSFLLLPVQRLPRYRLLLQNLIQVTDSSHPDYVNLVLAMQGIESRIKECNDAKRVCEDQKVLQTSLGGWIEVHSSRRGVVPKEELVRISRPGRRVIEIGNWEAMVITNSYSNTEWKTCVTGVTPVVCDVEVGGGIVVSYWPGVRARLVLFNDVLCWVWDGGINRGGGVPFFAKLDVDANMNGQFLQRGQLELVKVWDLYEGEDEFLVDVVPMSWWMEDDLRKLETWNDEVGFDDESCVEEDDGVTVFSGSENENYAMKTFPKHDAAKRLSTVSTTSSSAASHRTMIASSSSSSKPTRSRSSSVRRKPVNRNVVDPKSLAYLRIVCRDGVYYFRNTYAVCTNWCEKLKAGQNQVIEHL